MKGSIWEIGNHSWRLQVYVSEPGGKRRHFETVHGNKGDAQRRLREVLTSLDRGVPTPSGRLTLAEHLHQWLEGYVKANCSQRTQEGYQSIVEQHLIPCLGHIQLKHLTKQAIESYYGQAREKKSAGGKGLSPRTVHHQHRVLSQALKQAVIDGYLGSNPCGLIKLKVPRNKAMRTMTPGEVEALLDTAKDNQYYPVVYMAVSSGLRQAELLGLRWRDLDLDLLSISVSQVLYKRRGVCMFPEPKTEHSRRRVAMTPKLALFLRGYKVEREVLSLERGKPLTDDDLVFSNVEGKPLDPCVLSHDFARTVKGAGLKGVRFHDLRHTFASLMLLRGAKPKVISEALGHASMSFTMDSYSHIIEGMQEDAMALLDEVLPAGVNGVSQKNDADLTQTVDIKLHEN